MELYEKDLSRRTFLTLMGGAALAGSSIALAGCNGASEQTEESAASTSTEDAEQANTESSEASNVTAQTESVETAAASNVLVAYFSATGNTRYERGHRAPVRT